MSYTKYTWETGEVITAAKLNNMEDGIDDKLIVTMLDASTGEIDASYADLMAAWTAKKQVLIFNQATVAGMEVRRTLVLCSLFIQSGTYTAMFGSINAANGSFAGIIFVAETDSAHLAYEGD